MCTITAWLLIPYLLVSVTNDSETFANAITEDPLDQFEPRHHLRSSTLESMPSNDRRSRKRCMHRRDYDLEILMVSQLLRVQSVSDAKLKTNGVRKSASLTPEVHGRLFLSLSFTLYCWKYFHVQIFSDIIPKRTQKQSSTAYRYLQSLGFPV